jgi:hypothetical protein
MTPYYFAPPKLRFWVAGGCSLDFLFRFASRQNEKHASRRVRKIEHISKTIVYDNNYYIELNLM